MPCGPLKANRRFGGTYQLHLQGPISRASYQHESDGAYMFLHLQGRQYYKCLFYRCQPIPIPLWKADSYWAAYEIPLWKFDAVTKPYLCSGECCSHSYTMFCHMHLGFSNHLFRFSNLNFVYIFLLMRATCHAHLISLDLITLIILVYGEKYKLKISWTLSIVLLLFKTRRFGDWIHRRQGLALSIGPNWIGFTWRRREIPVSTERWIMSRNIIFALMYRRHKLLDFFSRYLH
jgi:hypothetical protein